MALKRKCNDPVFSQTSRQRRFPSGSEGKESSCNAGDLGLIPGWEDALEKRMSTHSSILTWEIPWIEEPIGLQFMRSQRVRHNLATKQQQ